MTKIKKVITKENYQLKVVFENGNSIKINLRNQIDTIRFANLKDVALFQKVETDGHAIKWPDGLEISMSELCQLAQK